jgi:GR25 family glycosyltransferase involved in LPS biosynthesis
MQFKDIHKFVINLDRRQDRLSKLNDEMSYIGWDFERFSAVDTNSYIGCAKSHQQISQIILDRGYDYAMVFEDDIFFMPYAKKLLEQLNDQLFKKSLNWDIINFAPSIHRPLNSYNEILLDLTNLPPKDETKHRGIYATIAFILTRKACEYIVEWDTDKFIENSHQQIPIDQYLDMVVYPNISSFCPIFPIMVQTNDYSDINKTNDSNHYLMTYNWNVYCPYKLPSNMLDHELCKNIRNNEN